MEKYDLDINGKKHTVQAGPETPLLWVIRDQLQLTGTKFGCGVASCGACTVHLDGIPVRSCQLPVSGAVGVKIRTIEGLEGKVAEAVQAAWQEVEVVQCGYCQSGQIMSAVGLLAQNPKPTEEETTQSMAGNVCRCATYARIHEAVKLASKKLEV